MNFKKKLLYIKKFSFYLSYFYIIIKKTEKLYKNNLETIEQQNFFTVFFFC